ncbi:MAG TPA: hypothetical protein VGL77_01955 [Armatimonadota bacterium]
MLSLRARFDLHRDLGQWSPVRYAQNLGYDPAQENSFVHYLQGKRELNPDEALMILDRHQFRSRFDPLPEEIVTALEELAAM